MSAKREKIRLGCVDIYGPTAREKRCGIFIDLAGLFGCEYNKDAVRILRAEWGNLNLKKRLDIDSESDFVSILVSKTVVVELAVLINNLSAEKCSLDEDQIAAARKEVKKWKSPTIFPWGVGDVFFMPLSENVIAYGQVLGKTAYGAPTCVLFEYFTDEPIAYSQEILKARALSILHVQSDHLDDQEWGVIGNAGSVLKPGSGPCGERGAVGSIESDSLAQLAKAWCSLAPWNKYYADDYLDKYLLNGVIRPEGVIFLARPELEALGVRRPEWV